MAAPAEIDGLRRMARDAYSQGRLADAVQVQTTVLARAAAAGVPHADDFLFAGLLHHAAGRPDDAIRIVRDGLGHYPAAADLHENLAVLLLTANDITGTIAACHTALSLGSASPNLHDCLCEAHLRSGRRDLAAAAGRAALEAKDRRFGDGPRAATIPRGTPTAFNPARPQDNVIAYALWGNQPRYHVPLLENARIKPHLFPAWTMRVYHDRTVDPAYLVELAARDVDLRPMALPPDVPAHRALLWRFEAIADPTVKRFLIRDADALLTVKERVAVDAWLSSTFHFHAMRDWYTHTDLLLAGMWGGVGGILPPTAALLRLYTAWRMETAHIDQDVLSETVWPTIRNNVLIHDSIFAPCLGSVRFPPFGLLLEGSHIGQNAFPHFSKTS